MAQVGSESAAPPREWVMRTGYRRTVRWLPAAWLVAVGIATLDALFRPGTGTFVYWSPFFLLYGIAFVWLSRYQVLTVRLTEGDLLEFVSAARVITIRLDALVEVAPARGLLQHRIATRFTTNQVRVTVLTRWFRDAAGLIAEIERRGTARVVRY